MLSHYEANELNAVFGVGLRGDVSAERRSGNWQCRLPETFIGEYLIVPLTSTRLLKTEGYVMNNCCREYSRQCEDQMYAMFSIRTRSGERIATLGLSKELGYWTVDQCYGPSNSEVMEEMCNFLDEDEVLQTEYFPTEIYYVAHEVVRLMNCVDCSH